MIESVSINIGQLEIFKTWFASLKLKKISNI